MEINTHEIIQIAIETAPEHDENLFSFLLCVKKNEKKHTGCRGTRKEKDSLLDFPHTCEIFLLLLQAQKISKNKIQFFSFLL